MTSIAWGALVTLAVFVFSNIGALIWSVAKITAVLNILQHEVRELSSEIKAMRELYVSKEAFTYRISQSDKEHAAMWREIDRLKQSA